MIDNQHLVRINPADGILEDEAEGTQIRPLSVRVIVAYELHLVRDCELIVQFLQLVVHKGCKHRILSPGPPVPYCRADLVGQIFQLLEERHLERSTAVGKENLERIFLYHFPNILLSSTSARKGPVVESGLAASCSGVPCATMHPPLRPPSGPRSKM